MFSATKVTIVSSKYVRPTKTACRIGSVVSCPWT